MTLKKKVFLQFSIFISLIIICIGLFNCIQTFSLIKGNLIGSAKESMTLGLNNINYYLQDTNNLCSSILIDPNVQKYIVKENYGDDFESKRDIRELMRILTQYASTRSYITKVYFVNSSGLPLDKDVNQTIVSSLDYTDETINCDFFVSAPYRASYSVGNSQVFSLVTTVYNNYKKEQILGSLIADIDYRVIRKTIDDFQLPIDGEICLLGNNIDPFVVSKGGTELSQEEIYSISSSSAYSKLIKGYGISVSSNLTGWKLLYLLPIAGLLRFVFPQLFVSLLLIILSICTVNILSTRMIRYIYIPINKLTASMKLVEHGELGGQILYDKPDEFSTVINGYNTMTNRLHELMAEIREKEETRKNAEIYALQAQISPHFLYNSLNSIRYYAKAYHANEIYTITVSLIQLAQASLSSDKFITIHQEIELAKQYIQIQKIRYGDIFQLHVHVNEDITNCLIPRFSIQPVVENALFHGILPVGEGDIYIEVKESDNGIEIQISDNGIGMSDEKIKSINADLAHADYTVSTNQNIRKLKNIGLENINYRLRTYYNSDEGCVRVYAQEKGTFVSIFIPEKVK